MRRAMKSARPHGYCRDHADRGAVGEDEFAHAPVMGEQARGVGDRGDGGRFRTPRRRLRRGRAARRGPSPAGPKTEASSSRSGVRPRSGARLRARSSGPGTPDGPCDTAPRCESPRPPRDRKGFTDWQSFAPPQRDRPAATVVYFCTAAYTHHRAYESVPRRFARIKPQQGCRVWGGRASRNGGCVGPAGPPRVGRCASTPSASQRRYRRRASSRLYSVPLGITVGRWR